MSLLMLLFTHQKESAALGISEAIFRKPVLFEQMPWPVLDPIVISLPVSIIVIVAVTILTPKQKAVTVAA
ncbi:MAG: hypothetical protein PF436_13210, partial [Prolixibacteraceae bacterium]|jgi:SSS family solute:Na+ symporter|nr:hypothetical protein [Prolixibacteraceae bacterium]